MGVLVSDDLKADEQLTFGRSDKTRTSITERSKSESAADPQPESQRRCSSDLFRTVNLPVRPQIHSGVQEACVDQMKANAAHWLEDTETVVKFVEQLLAA